MRDRNLNGESSDRAKTCAQPNGVIQGLPVHSGLHPGLEYALKRGQNSCRCAERATSRGGSLLVARSSLLWCLVLGRDIFDVVVAPAAPVAERPREPLKEIVSPMVGTFYRAGAPDAAPFVDVGAQVTEDTVVCIIEAMKLFNEIEAEFGGKVVKVLVENASPVEYDQPLFLIDPS